MQDCHVHDTDIDTHPAVEVDLTRLFMCRRPRLEQDKPAGERLYSVIDQVASFGGEYHFARLREVYT